MHLNLIGDKVYQERARRAMPILVRQAFAERQISYAALARELGMPNPRNLNYVLGAVGNSLRDLSNKWGTRVPPLQFLVVQKSTGVPGVGVATYTDEIESFAGLTLRQKRFAVSRVLGDIFAYPRWPDVLGEFGLPMPPPAGEPVLLQAVARWGGSGESEAHEALKAHVARTPSLLGLKAGGLRTDVEFALPSGDTVDVLFRAADRWVAVEVKAANAAPEDIQRGLFQCVKYQAVATALIAVEGGAEEATATLVLGGALPGPLLAIRNTLGVEVVERVVVPSGLPRRAGT